MREALRSIADQDIQASIVVLATPPYTDPRATAPELPRGTGGARYRILRPHAKGGLGEVFVAEDTELHREVALKQIQEQCADDARSRARFLLEAEVNGRLEHPAIVPVYALGQDAGGRPYYVMRFIEGDTLRETARRFHDAEQTGRDPSERSLALRHLLGQFVAMCNAVAYAHSRGIIHRDLKPSNVMLGKFGETLLVDWGLAKVVGRPEAEQGDGDGTLRPTSADDLGTVAGSAVGTPAFMSPEQADGRLEAIGPASDIYSLGATLYYLLTGKAPHEGKGHAEVLRKAARGNWLPPSQVKKEVPRALDAVCRKALALRPEDRYASAGDVARDVERWLADEPVSAYPEPLSVRSRRWLDRHRTLVTAAAACVLVSVVGLAVGLVLLSAAHERERESKQQEGLARELAESKRDEAKRQRDNARRNLYFSQMHLAQRAWDYNDVVYMRALLSQHRPAADGPDVDLRGWEWHYLWRLLHSDLSTVRGHAGAVTSVCFSPDGRRLGGASKDGAVKVWDVGNEQKVLTLIGHKSAVWAVGFSPDGRRLASGSGDETVKVRDAATGQEVLSLRGHTRAVTSVCFSPDGTRLASGSEDKTVKVWDTAIGKDVQP
jgi:serine/threonine protein kinase